ncbi:MAG TPA: hypothetical protein PLX89_01100 [Verrucomicrobiota bacterium]|nr:hypothetical protein [Verrucomicrobiota bacterium]
MNSIFFRHFFLSLNPFAGRMAGVGLALGLGCVAVGPVNAAPAGAVWAWGNNVSGQTKVPVAAQSGVTAIAAGGYHTVALKSDGTVVAWGLNEYGQTTVPAGLSGVTAIAAGGAHTVALKSDGRVVAWGNNDSGQTIVPAGLSGVTAIAARWHHTVGLKSDGTVVAWGWNGSGQTTVPAGLSGVTAIAAGYAHTVALKSDGTVVAWGGNDDGQTTVSAGLSGVTAIAAGRGYSVALKREGTVIAWGYNASGQVTGTYNDPGSLASPVTLGNEVLRGVTAVAAGENHTVALKSDGTMAAWGDNDSGQVTGTPRGGDAPFANPVTLGGEVLREVTAVAAGYGYTLALKRDGTVVAWGNDGSGQVTGTPTGDFALANPVTLGGEILRRVAAIAAGPYHAVALKSDGTVVAWGNDDNGQTDIPEDLRGVTAIAAGLYQTMALKADGSVVSWPDQSEEFPVLSGVTAIAAGCHEVAIIGTAPPYLRLVPGPAGELLSWPASATDYSLQLADRLDSVNWQPAPGTPIPEGSLNTLTVTPAATPQYFRLFKP